jgi:hypothetical protein
MSFFRFVVIADQIVPCNNRAEVFAAGDALAAAGVDVVEAWEHHIASGGLSRSAEVHATAEAPESLEWVARAIDSRCKHWTKIVPAGTPLPTTSSVSGANDVPGGYMRDGFESEVYAGDYVLAGEEVSHRKTRGWEYRLYTLARGGKSGKWAVCSIDFSGTKDKIRAVRDDAKKAGDKDRAARAADLLKGSGDVAAMVRHIQAKRDGLI